MKPTVNYSAAAKPYGFDVFSASGDIGSAPESGYHNDPFIAGESVRWLRENAAAARRTGQPFFMVSSFLNPHDVMYTDANVPGQPQVQIPVVPQATPPLPRNAIYQRTWPFSLPASLSESLTAPGMPPAFIQYQKGWNGWSGTIPADRKDMWTIFYNYYLNDIQDVDGRLREIVQAFDEMDLWRDTVIVFTADHGEMGGRPWRHQGQGAVPLRAERPCAAAHRPSGREGRRNDRGAHQPSRPAADLRRTDRVAGGEAAGGGGGVAGPRLLGPARGPRARDRDGDAPRGALQLRRTGHRRWGLPARMHGRPVHAQTKAAVVAGEARHPRLRLLRVRRALQVCPLLLPRRHSIRRGRWTIFSRTTTSSCSISRTTPRRCATSRSSRTRTGTTILRMNALLNDLMTKEVGVNDGRFMAKALAAK